MITPIQRNIIKRCQSSVSFFLKNFGKLKHPSAGILPFDPFSYQKKAIKAFRQNRFVIFRKCRQCFRGDQMVWGPLGPKRIDTIKAGDLVYSYNQSTGLLEAVPVLETFDNGERECVAVSTKTGHRSIATVDHNYFLVNGQAEARTLTQDDTLLEVNEPVRIGIDTDESEAILLGYLIADGYYGSHNRQIHFTNTRWKYLLEVQKHFQRRFGVRLQILKHMRNDKGDVSSYRIATSRSEVKAWLSGLGILGQKRNLKRIPDIVFRWSNRSIAIFLNRLFAADGWYSGSHCNEIGIGQESLEMLHQIKQLLSRFEINSTIYPPTKTGMAKLRIYGSTSFKTFFEKIGIVGKEPRIPITKGFFFNRRKGAIRRVTKLKGVHKVYDISVPPHNNYIVDGVVVHNSGASKISGAFALWFAMFHSNKTILIVSRRDADAMSFLADHIVFLYEHLPEWMKALWLPTKQNEHEIEFPNGSKIKSLTSHPDVMRSHASSLNIIDEAAFIQNMDVMWAGGWSTLQHGGNAIVVSTTSGVGGWYWSTWTDSEAGANQFTPLMINWWDMDWVIEYTDPLSKNHMRIAPRDGIRECKTKEEIAKYGPYWSPWLEEQYRALQEQGEAWKFDQEVLAKFVGSGNTVLDKSVIAYVSTTVKNPTHRVKGTQTYVHPTTGNVEELSFDFPEQEGLWIWREPVLAKPEKRRGGVIVEPGVSAHSYTMGVDIATGKGRDYSAIEIFDVDAREQAAEFMVRCLPREFIKYIDRIGRWYNCALAVIERNNGGDIVIDSLRYDVMYPRIWRKKDINDKPQPPAARGKRKVRAMKVGQYGYMTTVSSKPALNKFLQDHIRDNVEGFQIFSKRLLKQIETYVRKRDRAGRDTMKTEAEEGAGNFDDLVMAAGLALVGLSDAFVVDAGNMMPVIGGGSFKSLNGPVIMGDAAVADQQKEYAQSGGPALLMPISLAPTEMPDMAAQRYIDAFTLQLGGIPMAQGKPLVTPKNYYYRR